MIVEMRVCVCHLDQMWGILSVQGVFGELVSVRHPGVSKDLSSRQPPVRVDVQHPGHQVLNEGRGHSPHAGSCSEGVMILCLMSD